MSLKVFSVLAAVAFSAVSAMADAYPYLCQPNVIGDRRLVSIDGVKTSFARDVVVDLLPTNAPAGSYEIRCRVVYADPDMPIPGERIEQFDHFERIDGLLEGWLREFVASEYVGAEFRDLVARYYQGDLAKDLDVMFKRYAGERLAELEKAGEGVRLDVIMVEVSSAADLRRWLVATYAAEKASDR